jgi:hypothetical protein
MSAGRSRDHHQATPAGGVRSGTGRARSLDTRMVGSPERRYRAEFMLQSRLPRIQADSPDMYRRVASLTVGSTCTDSSR